jgi:tetratricopeptide (TPR) repeat protein
VTLTLFPSLLLLVSVTSAVGQSDSRLPLEAAVLRGDLAALETIHQQIDTATVSATAGDVTAPYAWAYSGWRVSQRLPKQRKRDRDKLLKSIQRGLEDWLDTDPDDAEALALLGSVLGDRIGGPLSAIRLGGKASEALEKAYTLAPENPRVALQRGVGFFFTPRAFGGGKDKAEVELRRARSLFEANDNALAGKGWGYTDTLARLGEVLAALEKFDEARSVYLRALVIAPNFAWVRDDLLPRLPPA